MKSQNLIENLENAKNTALVVGAGISFKNGIPLGYSLPMEFAERQQPLMKELGLLAEWERARISDDWQFESVFVNSLVQAFHLRKELQQEFLSWMTSYPAMIGTASDEHLVFVIAWLRRIFKHLITTNWDFLLEWQVDTIYEEAYTGDPFEPVSVFLSDGAICEIPSERLFYLDPLTQEESFWSPRWDIVSNPQDLQELKRWGRPLWKIHGSPFFLACPKCGALNRWKRVSPLQVGESCPSHPDTPLAPEITFWGESIDVAHPQVWRTVKMRLQRCDMIVACGFSGSGSDSYIRQVIENNRNGWIVNPTQGSWNTTKVHYIEASASDLANTLLEHFLAK